MRVLITFLSHENLSVRWDTSQSERWTHVESSRGILFVILYVSLLHFCVYTCIYYQENCKKCCYVLLLYTHHTGSRRGVVVSGVLHERS